MKSDNSKLLLGLVVGAAIGAAIGYFLASDSDKKDEILGRIGDVVEKTKKKIAEAINSETEESDLATDEANL